MRGPQGEEDFFSTSPGQAALRNVLIAYATHNPTVGYCQSMNFLAALLLLQVQPFYLRNVTVAKTPDARVLQLQDEEAAFWVLVSIVEDKLDQYYHRSLSGLRIDQVSPRAQADYFYGSWPLRCHQLQPRSPKASCKLPEPSLAGRARRLPAPHRRRPTGGAGGVREGDASGRPLAAPDARVRRAASTGRAPSLHWEQHRPSTASDRLQHTTRPRPTQPHEPFPHSHARARAPTMNARHAPTRHGGRGGGAWARARAAARRSGRRARPAAESREEKGGDRGAELGMDYLNYYIYWN